MRLILLIPTLLKEETLEFLLFEKCWIDTVQWHLEDLIRNPNLDLKNVLAIKHRIDSSNQKRTDIVEEIDDYYFHIFKEKSNSESRDKYGKPWVGSGQTFYFKSKNIPHE